MKKAKIMLLFICVGTVFACVLASNARSFNYVWIVEPLHPELGCTLQLRGYTLEPNQSSMGITFASIISTSTCEMKVLYTGE